MTKKSANHFLGINWTVRAKHPQFWLGIVLSILVPPLAYTGTEFNEVTSWDKFFTILGDGFKNPYIVLMMIVGIYNTIVDKTTKGFSDSYIAKQYLRPRTDKDPRYALDWEVNLDKKAKAKAQAQKEQQEAQQPSKENEVAKTSDDEHIEGNEQIEDDEQTKDDEVIAVDQSEIVDGVEGSEISDGDVRDEIELNNQTAEDTFGDIDNEIFGDSAEPQEIGNDTDEEYREKQADADIRGTDIRG